MSSLEIPVADSVPFSSTKIKANASRHKAMSYERMQKTELELKAKIDALLAKAKAADQAKRNEPDLDIPAEITRREDRLAGSRQLSWPVVLPHQLAVIQAARAGLEERQRQADTERGRSADDENQPPVGRAQLIPHQASGRPPRQSSSHTAVGKKRKSSDMACFGWINTILGILGLLMDIGGSYTRAR